jgi:hypothetical protein
MFNEIIVSLVTSVITWTILTFGKTILIPFYESLVYKGVHIDGIWVQNSKLNIGEPDEIEYTETIKIEQKANKITGIYTVTNMVPNQSSMTSIYKIHGVLVNGYLTLTGEISNNNQIGVCNFLLKVIAGGRKMAGAVVILNRDGDDIYSYEKQEYTKDDI